MRVPDEVRKCVAFVGVREKDGAGNDKLNLKGTCFFVMLPSELENWVYNNIVTARHVAEELEGKDFFVRLNTTKEGQH